MCARLVVLAQFHQADLRLDFRPQAGLEENGQEELTTRNIQIKGQENGARRTRCEHLLS